MMERKERNKMCDKTEFHALKERVRTVEVQQARLDEQIKTLFKSSQTMYRTICIFFLILLLAVVYGALGSKGFNAVTGAAARANVISNQK